MPSPPSNSFSVGRGLADITGEAADCGMLGYGKGFQQTAGIHTRLRARAFVIEDTAGERVLLVVNDLPLVLESIHREVLRRLATAYGDLYTARNVMITATHTHCGPGGYSHHRLYNSNTGGFRPQTFAAIVDGMLEAIERAHADLEPATLTLAHGELYDASSNRSPSSFARNPEADRAFFPEAIDPQTTLLGIHRGAELVGAVNWFATHGTSMTNQNLLISADNKGYAAYHWERLVDGGDYLADVPPRLVTAFAQTNTGDMSPNLNHRPGSGPTEDEFENTRLIGLRQYDAAAKLAADAGDPVGEGVDARVTYVDLTRMTVRAEFAGDGREHTTGTPIAGAAALAGTDEGKGFAGFRQGRNPVWDTLSKGLYRLSPRLRDAQAPKGLALPGGLVNRVTPLIAERFPVQLVRIGRLYLIGIPGEVTIVAGLRLRRTVAAIVGADLRDVLVAGYSNGYLHYVTTPEEYDEQRYEGGSTFYGRWELAALTQVAAGLAEAMVAGRPVPPGAVPTAITARPAKRRTEYDEPPVGHQVGNVLSAPTGPLRPGDRAVAEFVAAYPNHDLRRGSTYLLVQRAEGDNQDPIWADVADDGDWATRFGWRREGTASVATLTWDIPAGTQPGTYRICYLATTRSRTTTAPIAAATEPFTLTL